MFIGLMTPQAHAQTLSPLTEDQDGDGDPLNEEDRIKITCDVDFVSNLGEAVEDAFGYKMETTLSEDDCDFVMSIYQDNAKNRLRKVLM